MAGMRTRFDWANLANAGRNGAYRDNGYSPTKGTSIWETCPQLAALDPAVAIRYFEDFVAASVDDTTGIPTTFAASGDHKTTIYPKVAGGVLSMECGNTDNDEFYLQLGSGALHAPFIITDAGAKPLWFECYAKAGQHADAGWFIGMAEEGCAAADFMTNDDAILADKDLIGFHILTASPTAWDVVWKKAGQAQQAVLAQAVNADDYHRFGFVFDGASTVTFYIDRTAVATVATTSAATFPSAQALAPIFGVKTGEAVTKTLLVDYIKVVQIR